MFNSVSDLDVDWLKANHQMIHYFGLGFIQLKLNDRYRLHFYTSELPAIVGEEEVHNHRYDFTSKILAGSLTQELFSVVPGTDHVLEQETCKPGMKPDFEAKPCSILKKGRQVFQAGSEYFIAHGEFHRVVSSNAITFLDRGPYEKENAEVVRRVDSAPICPFEKKINEDKLWTLVKAMIEAARKA